MQICWPHKINRPSSSEAQPVCVFKSEIKPENVPKNDTKINKSDDQ